MPKKHDFQIFIFGEKFTSPTRNDDRGGKFFFQKLVSDDLKWSEMPKKHDFQILNFGEKFHIRMFST